MRYCHRSIHGQAVGRVLKHTMYLPFVILPLLETHPASAQIGPSVPPTATKTAILPGSVVDFPNDQSSGFEEPRIDGVTIGYVYFGALTPPQNVWRQWTFTGGSGIAIDGSAFTYLNPNAPEGTHVAFLQGGGAMACLYEFQPGTWRLRFQAAQRKQGAGVNQQVVRITADTMQLAELEFADEQYAEYVTRAFTIDTATTMMVLFQGLNPYGGDNTALLDDIRLERIWEWDSSATWGGSVPTANDDVSIPAGKVVALRGLANVAQTVNVGGELVVTNRDTALASDWVMIMGSGSRFEVGTADTPFEQDFTLTLTAVDDGTNIMGAGSKFLMAMDGGTIDLHGLPRLSWTKLNATAFAGATGLTLLDPVDWEVGDEIIIAGTRHQIYKDTGAPDYTDYAEKRQITSVNGTAVALNAPLAYKHHGGTPQVYTSPGGKSWTLDQRAEVGLLTRNVKIQGDAASETAGYGGHMMVMRTGSPGGHGSAYVSGVELYRMGQKSELGRYPMHWHVMLDEAQGQYITDSSIHESYNRAVTIHGTDYLRVERNVAYRNLGHAIFLEDGSEQYNQVNYNLVLSTLKPLVGQEVLPSDNELDEVQNRCPSSFWITNPLNEFKGNVAAGTEGTGFWFAFPFEPMGFSAQEPYFDGREPIKNPLGAFEDNVCHSSGSGFDVNDSIWIGHEPQFKDHSIRKNQPWVPPSAETIKNFTAYACHDGIYAGIGNELVIFDNAVIADCNEHSRLAAYHTIQNSVFVANTGNVQFVANQERGYVVYDGAGRLKDSHLVGFDQGTRWSIWGGGAATLHPNHLFSGITFDPPGLANIYAWDFASEILPDGSPKNKDYDDPQNKGNPRHWGLALRDVDGSVWGVPGATIIGNHPMMYLPSADITPSGVPPTNAKLSPFRFGHVRIRYPGLYHEDMPFSIVQREANGSYPSSFFQDPFQIGLHKQWPVIVDGGFRYTVTWNLPLEMDEMWVTLDDVETTDVALLTLNDIGAQPGLVVSSAQGITQVFTRQELDAATFTCYLIAGNGALWLKLASVDKEQRVDLAW